MSSFHYWLLLLCTPEQWVLAKVNLRVITSRVYTQLALASRWFLCCSLAVDAIFFFPFTKLNTQKLQVFCFKSLPYKPQHQNTQLTFRQYSSSSSTQYNHIQPALLPISPGDHIWHFAGKLFPRELQELFSHGR